MGMAIAHMADRAITMNEAQALTQRLTSIVRRFADDGEHDDFVDPDNKRAFEALASEIREKYRAFAATARGRQSIISLFSSGHAGTQAV